MANERIERTIQSLEETSTLLLKLLEKPDTSSPASNTAPDQLQHELEILKAENAKLRVRVACLCRALDERDMERPIGQ